MPSDDGLTPQQREAARREHEAAAMAEMDEMDNVILHGAEPVATEPEPAPSPELEPGEEVEAPPLEVAAEEVPVEEGVESETPPEDEDEYDFNFINELARNAMLQHAPLQPVAAAPTPAAAPVAPAPVAASAPQQIAIASLEEMNEAFTSPEKFIELLDKVAMRAEERALLRLPQVARQVSMQVIDHAAAVQEFYNKNPELKQYHDFVGYCARVVESKHPDWAADKVAEETARVAKSQIPALRRAQQAGKQRPALPGAGRAQQRRTAAANSGLSALQKEIDEMPNSAF